MNKLFITGFLLIGIAGVGLFFYIATPSSTGLLKPTGPYGIGTTTYHLIDSNRKEPHADTGGQRELMVQVWYPTDVHDMPKTAYIPSQKSLEIIKADIQEVFKVSADQVTFLDTLKTHAQFDAPVSSQESSYPVILFSPGSGAPVVIYSTLIEELASHGYIVVGISYPYITNPVEFPGSRVVKNIKIPELQKIWGLQTESAATTKEQDIWVADIQFVLDNLKEIDSKDLQNILTGKLGLKNIGLAGHSFGGGASVHVCALDKRCKAVANIDGRFTYSADFDHGFNTPLMVIRNPFHKEDKKNQLLSQMQRMTGPTRYHEVPEMLHGSFTDLGLFIVEKGKEKRTINPRDGLRTTRKLLLNFFDTHLK
jgi:dienelactone hydrolase